MNNQTKKEKEKQATRILYFTIAAMLFVMAIVVALSSVISNDKPLPEVTDTDIISDSDVKNPPMPDTDKTPTETPDTNKIPTIVETEDDDEDADVTPMPTVPTLSLPISRGILSKDYSPTVLVYSTTMEDYRTHMGIDINSSIGEGVMAAASGKIADVWYDPMMGQCIKIEHEGGLYTIYKNLSEELPENIASGTHVSKNDIIGYIGDTAIIEIAQEPHLHLEATYEGKYVNPIDYMEDAAKQMLTEDSGYEG